MKYPLLIGVVIVLAGCASSGSLSDAQRKMESSTTGISGPDIAALRRLIDQVDRVTIGYPLNKSRPTSDATVEDPEAIRSLQELLRDPSVTPSYMIASMGDEPLMTAYRGKTELFLLFFQSPTRFEIYQASDPAVVGGYIVPASWLPRYLEFCGNWEPKWADDQQPPTDVPKSRRAELRKILDVGFDLSAIPDNREADFYLILEDFSRNRRSDEFVSRLSFQADGRAQIDIAEGQERRSATVYKRTGRWFIGVRVSHL